MNIISINAVKFYYKNGYYFTVESNKKHFILRERGIRYISGFSKLSWKIANSYNINKIEILDSDHVIDVGANNGDLLLYLPQCRYYGFEPSLSEYKLLGLNSPRNAVINNKAVGNFTGPVKFYISSAKADSSVFEPLEFESVVQIDQIKLDDFITNPIKLLKVEAEGAELEVLEGARESLSKIEYIAVDASFEKGKQKLSPAVDIINYLYSNNFELISLSPKERYLFKNKNYK
jgi:FkbM family methyltransferase